MCDAVTCLSVGKVTQALLEALDVSKVADILRPEKRAIIIHVFGNRMFAFLVQSALGVSGSPTDGNPTFRKGISREKTFKSIKDPQRLRQVLSDICSQLASDVAAVDGIDGGKCVSLKLKLSDFTVRSRSKTLRSAVCSADAFLRITQAMLEEEIPVEARLIGVRLSTLVGLKSGQSGALLQVDEKQTKIDNFFESGVGDTSAMNQTESCTYSAVDMISCPICNSPVNFAALNDHLDSCDISTAEEIPSCPLSPPSADVQPRLKPDGEKVEVAESAEVKELEIMICPVCNSANFPLSDGDALLNTHIDICLNEISGHLGKRNRDKASHCSSGSVPKLRKDATMDCFIVKGEPGFGPRV
jgi:hypothetical protein